MRNKHIVNLKDADEQTLEQGDRFAFVRRGLSASTGGEKLGCSYFEVQPGKRAFPFHAHLANEEAMFILEGSGSLRLGGESIPVQTGDYIALPADADLPHQLVNTSQATIRYLCISTNASPEVVLYPDSKKVGMLAGRADTETGAQGDHSKKPASRWKFAKFLRDGESLDYFDGEDGETDG